MPGIDQKFAVAVLRKWGRPVTATSVRNVLGWMAAEGGHTHNKARFNFLNTTQPAPGAGNTGSQGNIKVYPDFNTGVDATVKTLKNGRYAGIAQAVNSDPSSFARAVNQSPWGTKSDFSSISRSAKVDPSALSQAAASPAASPMTQQRPSVDGAQLLALLKQTSERALRGEMPGEGYRRQLALIAQNARLAPTVGQVASAMPGGGKTAPMIGDLPGALASQNPGPDGLFGFKAGGVDSGLAFRGGAGGNWGGSMPRALSLARAVGANPSSGKRSRKLTASGNPSDHWVGSTQSYATDLPASGAAGDALLKKISQALGVPLKSGTWNNVNIGGYRYQIGWKTSGHFDHVHVGVKKL